jgi:hypothetical protein
VRVDVVDDLFSRVALDAADGLATRSRGLGCNGCANLERYALRPRRAGERLGGRASETKSQAHRNTTQRRDDGREPEKTVPSLGFARAGQGGSSVCTGAGWHGARFHGSGGPIGHRSDDEPAGVASTERALSRAVIACSSLTPAKAI